MKYFSQKTGFDTSCKLSIFWKKKKKNINLWSTEIAHGVIKIDLLFSSSSPAAPPSGGAVAVPVSGCFPLAASPLPISVFLVSALEALACMPSVAAPSFAVVNFSFSTLKTQKRITPRPNKNIFVFQVS